MSAIESSPSTFYQSLYRHGIDEKRRLQVPAKWRPVNPDVEFTLIPWPTGGWKEACLLVLPPQERETLVKTLKAMPYADTKAQALRRLLASKSDQVTLDKSGRLCLPEAMTKAVGIDKEAVLVGMFDRFEIWSPERYAVTSAVDEELSSEAFKLI
jgi:transcriptional regulator MraZ